MDRGAWWAVVDRGHKESGMTVFFRFLFTPKIRAAKEKINKQYYIK